MWCGECGVEGVCVCVCVCVCVGMKFLYKAMLSYGKYLYNNESLSPPQPHHYNHP